MANHKSAIKRIRSSEKRRVRNRYNHKTARNAVRELRALTSKKEAEEKFSKIVAMLDKLAKRNIIHKNKAARLQSRMRKRVNQALAQKGE
jgi:small subunit ribosomal protein S20